MAKKSIHIIFRGTKADREILRAAARERDTDMSSLFREFLQSLSTGSNNTSTNN